MKKKNPNQLELDFRTELDKLSAELSELHSKYSSWQQRFLVQPLRANESIIMFGGGYAGMNRSRTAPGVAIAAQQAAERMQGLRLQPLPLRRRQLYPASGHPAQQSQDANSGEPNQLAE